MKLIIDGDRVIAEASDSYTGPQHWIDVPADYIPGSFVLPIQQTLASMQAVVRGKLLAQYDTRVQALASGYSQYERESWPVQTAEATAYSADPLGLTPWLDAASAARGVDKAELVARVLAMDTAYRQIHGALTGHRQKLWDQIAAAQVPDDIAAIDVAAGWST